MLLRGSSIGRLTDEIYNMCPGVSRRLLCYRKSAAIFASYSYLALTLRQCTRVNVFVHALFASWPSPKNLPDPWLLLARLFLLAWCGNRVGIPEAIVWVVLFPRAGSRAKDVWANRVEHSVRVQRVRPADIGAAAGHVPQRKCEV